MNYTPKHIERWHEMINYSGENFDKYYIGAYRPFKCTPCERANFEYITALVRDSGSPPDQILLAKFHDEMLMGRYYLLIHESAIKALKMADMLNERMMRKGSLDPESEKCIDDYQVHKKWNTARLSTKVRICSEAGISIFVARQALYPEGHPGSGNLYDILSEMA